MMNNKMATIPMPDWVIPRDGWNYAGWISRYNTCGGTFDEAIESALRSDHGELREVDVYLQGAAVWWK